MAQVPPSNHEPRPQTHCVLCPSAARAPCGGGIPAFGVGAPSSLQFTDRLLFLGLEVGAALRIFFYPHEQSTTFSELRTLCSKLPLFKSPVWLLCPGWTPTGLGVVQSPEDT